MGITLTDKDDAKNHIINWLDKLVKKRVSCHLNIALIGKNEISISSTLSAVTITTPFDPISFGTNREDCCAFLFDSVELDDFSCTCDLILPFSDKPEKLVEKNEKHIRIHYDVFGMIFWSLSRREEANRESIDHHGRFLSIYSHAHRHGYLQRPIVDEWLEFIRLLVSRFIPEAPLISNKYKFYLTHDVDHVRRYKLVGTWALINRVLEDIWITRSIAPLLTVFNSVFRHRLDSKDPDPYNTFDWLVNLAKLNNLQSTFYFITKSGNRSVDAKYNINDDYIIQLIRKISSEGHSIGLHPTYGSYLDREKINGEKNDLMTTLSKAGCAQKNIGVRMHYLQYSIPETLTILASLGFEHDASFGYPDKTGFRCGTCFEYDAIDPVSCVEYEIKVRPLIAMDCSLLSKSYEGLTVNEAYERIIELMSICKKYNGGFSLLWHNSYFQIPGTKRLLEKILSAS